jgi:quercetin dioxygenase-like cupin family protein
MFTITRINPPSRRAAVAIAGLVLAVTVSLAVAAMTVLPSLVKATQHITVETLTSRAVFTDDVAAQIRFKLDGGATTVLNMPEASRTLVARFTVQPGAQFPWHTHPGPVIVNIVQGELVYVQASDCVERGYPAGTVFIDPGRGNVHSAFNPSDSLPTIFVATFLDFPADGPLSINDASQTHCAMPGGTH